MKVPFLDLQAQYQSLKPAINEAVQEVLDTSTYCLGPSVENFEQAFATFCGTEHCIAVNSGTSALTLLLAAHSIGKGDEVITVANTFFATVEAICHVGATPVLVDCRQSDALIDPVQIAAAITPRTKAIIPVHLYGQPADMEDICAIAKQKDILVFEDACQAHGARYKGKRTGNLANGAAFSFYPGKNLGAYGEGGAVTTNDGVIAKRLRALRDHGSPKKYHHDVIGWNERMDGIQGAVLGVKLPHLDAWNAARRKHATMYRTAIPAGYTCFVEHTDREHVYHLFVVRVQDRDRVQKHLQAQDIATSIHYPIPLHLQPAMRSIGWKEGNFPIAETLAKEILSLPMFPELTEQQLCFVTQNLAAVLR
jgi:dTDP-4-amino-4,6-dideoxygalactose transaminase